MGPMTKHGHSDETVSQTVSFLIQDYRDTLFRPGEKSAQGEKSDALG